MCKLFVDVDWFWHHNYDVKIDIMMSKWETWLPFFRRHNCDSMSCTPLHAPVQMTCDHNYDVKWCDIINVIIIIMMITCVHTLSGSNLMTCDHHNCDNDVITSIWHHNRQLWWSHVYTPLAAVIWWHVITIIVIMIMITKWHHNHDVKLWWSHVI